MRRRLDAGQVAGMARCPSHASVLLVSILVVSRRTVYPVASVTASGIVTNLVRSSAYLSRVAFVDILAASLIVSEPVTLWTLASVASRRIFANTNAQMIIFKFCAFVDVRARSIVGV